MLYNFNPFHYMFNMPFYNFPNMMSPYSNPNWFNNLWYNNMNPYRDHHLKDYGPYPLTINIEDATLDNTNYRTALWTGKHLQVTLMSIDVGDDIGLEVHPDVDQFLRIEEGNGLVEMGKTKTNLDYKRRAKDDDAIMVPAGTWHNVTNTGNKPLKLYAIYAPPEHPRGTVHKTKAIAMAEEHH